MYSPYMTYPLIRGGLVGLPLLLDLSAYALPQQRQHA
jgi:hypothetical protein